MKPSSTLSLLFICTLCALITNHIILAQDLQDGNQGSQGNQGFEGLEELGSLFGSLLGGAANGGGGPNSCVYKCPNGETPKPKEGHNPRTNGCGTGTMLFSAQDMKYDFTKCCDEHDFCYDTCGKNRDTCDTDFKTCLTKLCDTDYPHDPDHQACTSSAQMFHFGTSGFGCAAFLASQKEACECPAGLPRRAKRNPSLSSKLGEKKNNKNRGERENLRSGVNKNNNEF